MRLLGADRRRPRGARGRRHRRRRSRDAQAPPARWPGRDLAGSYAMLAYRTDAVERVAVGYAQFGPLSAYPRAQYIRDRYPSFPSRPRRGSSPASRSGPAGTAEERTEVALALLGAVCAELDRRGITAVEAYPEGVDDPWLPSPGPASVYEAAGFATRRRRRSVSRSIAASSPARPRPTPGPASSAPASRRTMTRTIGRCRCPRRPDPDEFFRLPPEKPKRPNPVRRGLSRCSRPHFWGLVAGSMLVVGALLALFIDVPRRLVAAVMAFGAGALISALAFDLTEEAFSTGGTRPSCARARRGGGGLLRRRPADRTDRTPRASRRGSRRGSADDAWPGHRPRRAPGRDPRIHRLGRLAHRRARRVRLVPGRRGGRPTCPRAWREPAT